MDKHVYLLDNGELHFSDLQDGNHQQYSGFYTDITEEQLLYGTCEFLGSPIKIDTKRPSYIDKLRKDAIKEQLNLIDQKKVRAISDSLLTGDTSKLRQLEEEATALRSQL